MLKIARLDKRVYDLLAAWRERGNEAWDSGFLGLIVRYLPWFEAERIDYMFTYSTAIRLHGGECGQDVSLAVTPASWERICQTQGRYFVARPDGNMGSLSVRGWGYASTVKFLDSLDSIRVSIGGIQVASLPYLIGGLLSRPSDVTRKYVVSLIRANDLDASYRRNLPAPCRAAFASCLRNARQERSQT
jgi:hypothetical protein